MNCIGAGCRIPPLRSVRIDLCRTTNRTDVSTQESGRDEISLRVGINLLAEAMRVAAIIRARAPDATHTYIHTGNSPAVVSKPYTVN